MNNLDVARFDDKYWLFIEYLLCKGHWRVTITRSGINRDLKPEIHGDITGLEKTKFKTNEDVIRATRSCFISRGFKFDH